MNNDVLRTDVLHTDVLIAGAGPTGLVLALELASQGIAARIVDTAPPPDGGSRGSRGKGLQPRTQEIFEDLGVLDAIRAQAAPYPPLRAYGGPGGSTVVWEGRLHEPRPASPDVPYPDILMLAQYDTERVLRDRLAGHGVTVEDGTALTGFSQDDDGVTATLAGSPDVRAKYLVGADGGRSQVRRALGVGFVGSTHDEERMVVADVRLGGPLDTGHWHMWGNLATGSIAMGLCPLPGDGVFQLTAPLAPDEAAPPDLDAMRRLVADRTGRADLDVRAVSWSSLYRVNIRMADRYRVGRVLLAGDAAHVHSPAGGQGLNTGVQDAHNLGWKLAAVLRGAPPELVDSYEEERLPVAADVLGLSTLLLRDGVGAGLGRTGSGDVDGDAPRRGRDTDQIDVGYRGGPLSRDARLTVPAGGIEAGDRAPDAPCTGASGPVRLFELLRGPQATVLVLPGTAGMSTEWWAHAVTPAAVTPTAAGAPPAVGVQVVVVRPVGSAPASGPASGAEVVDADGHLVAAYGLVGESGLVVAIRPDGYVGLLADATADGAEAVSEYLARLGAAPLPAAASAR